MKTRSRKTTAKRRSKALARAPRTVDELFAASKQSQDEWERAVHLVSSMRAEGLSFAAALAESGLSRATALRLVKPALRKRRNGRYVATSADRLLRVLVVPSSTGLVEVVVRDSKEASRLATYLNAVHRYLAKGDDEGLDAFSHVRVRGSDGVVFNLITDTETLDYLGGAGVLSFESIYARGGR